MVAYYNEFDEKAAAWLRELIARGLIAPGDVDTRSIEDVSPADLAGYTQCHFFAGIGVWSYALRRAGWPDDRAVWTGSCPCQPFSAAGKGAGFADERHLWPAWFWLIEQCRPAIVFGEQVASKDAEPWIDLVQDDLEALGYGVGAVPFPSAGVGAPHIRDRLYWVADSLRSGWPEGWSGAGDGSIARSREPDRMGDASLPGLEGHGWDGSHGDGPRWHDPLAAGPIATAGPARELGDAKRFGTGWNAGTSAGAKGRNGGGAECNDARPSSPTGGMADAESTGGRANDRAIRGGQGEGLRDAQGEDIGWPEQPDGWPLNSSPIRDPGPTNGLWRDADWLFCRDGKWRPVEPGTFPLAHGAPARVGRLRGYGNAICAPAAQTWIESYLDTRTIDLDVRRLRLGVFA